MSELITCRLCGEAKPRYRNYARCRECQLGWQRRRYAANPEPFKELARRYRLANPERVREWDRQRYVSNPAAHKAYNRRWRKRNPRKLAEHARRANAKRRAAGRISKEVAAGILEAQGNRCTGCLKPFTDRRKPTLDHIRPVKDGGDNSPANLQMLCKPCNSSKQAMDWRMWLQRKHGRLF